MLSASFSRRQEEIYDLHDLSVHSLLHHIHRAFSSSYLYLQRKLLAPLSGVCVDSVRTIAPGPAIDAMQEERMNESASVEVSGEIKQRRSLLSFSSFVTRASGGVEDGDLFLHLFLVIESKISFVFSFPFPSEAERRRGRTGRRLRDFARVS